MGQKNSHPANKRMGDCFCSTDFHGVVFEGQPSIYADFIGLKGVGGFLKADACLLVLFDVDVSCRLFLCGSNLRQVNGEYTVLYFGCYLVFLHVIGEDQCLLIFAV